jgi:multidrug efflux pump subunit AcrB
MTASSLFRSRTATFRLPPTCASCVKCYAKAGNSIQVVGQIQSMKNAFRDLGMGLLFAAVFVYLLMVVNYQNFGDPFVVILALPATFCGILTMLFVTGTTLNVPSLMGAIMAVGVASANAILLVTFAREQQLAGRTAFEPAIDAGHTRIQPCADDRRRDGRRHDPDGDRRRGRGAAAAGI